MPHLYLAKLHVKKNNPELNENVQILLITDYFFRMAMNEVLRAK